jgi:hypothetical protein
MGGAFVETLCRLPVESTVSVRLEVPEVSDPITVEGQVRWSRPGGSMAGGMGLMFGKLDELQANTLYRFLQPPRVGASEPLSFQFEGREAVLTAPALDPPDYLEYRVFADGIPRHVEINLAFANTDRVWPPK